MDWGKGHKGTFWGAGKILNLDLGSTACSLWQNPPSCTLNALDGRCATPPENVKEHRPGP